MIEFYLLFYYGVYMAGIALAVWLGRRIARALGASPRAVRWTGLAVGAVPVLIAFWDTPPTIIAYKYYCNKEAGFFVNKTLEQWKEENPGVAETLTWQEKPVGFKDPARGVYDGYILNERFVSESVRLHDLRPVPVTVTEDRVVDRRTGETLARHVRVGTGYANPAVDGDGWHSLKLWLSLGPCDGERMPSRGAFARFEFNAMRLGVKQ